MTAYGKKIVKENIITKKRYAVNYNKKNKNHNFFSPTIGEYSKHNMITFNNLIFINDEGIKFAGSFSLMYKITDYVKFSYHKNYAEVLKAITEAYLQNLFSTVKYYDMFDFNPIKIKVELNMLVSKYIEGIKIIDVSDINIENHLNMVFDNENIMKKDSFYKEEDINENSLEMYTDTGKFVLSTEDIERYSTSSRTNIKSEVTNEYYVPVDEFSVLGKKTIIKSGYHFISIPGRSRINYNDNVYITGKLTLDKNDLKNGIYDYMVEGKLIYQITDPVKYTLASREYEMNDYLTRSFYNFLKNFDRVYGINNIKPVLDQSSVMSLFKYNNEEYLLKLEEYGIKVNTICIVSKEKVDKPSVLTRK